MVDELEALYRERLPDFTRAATAIAGDEESGRDAVQEAFAKALRKRRRFRGEGNLEAWVWPIVINAARDAGRRRRRKLVAPPHGVLQLQTSDGPLDLWAAPESDGSGTCWFVGWESDISADHAIGTGSCTESNDAAITPETYNDASHPSYTVLVGSVTGSETTLDVTLTDGRTTTLPVVEHLFLGALPHGSELASITGRDASGNVVASWTPSG